MGRATVLVIEQGAEAGLICAALAMRPELDVVGAPDVAGALERIEREPGVALAIAGASALGEGMLERLGGRGIPVVGLAAGLAPEVRRRAMAAGVREIHERPRRWRPYSELVDALVARFIPADSPPRPGRTS
jgi:hypothetical protein